MRVLLLLLSTLFVNEAFAQKLSLKDLTEQIESQSKELEGFLALLQHPDQIKNIAAMKAMLASGDPALVRMALEVGAYSPDSALREIALSGYMNTQPNLSFKMKFPNLQNEDDAKQLNSFLSNYLKTSLGSDQTATLTVSIGKYDKANNCFGSADSSSCLLRLSGSSFSLSMAGVWTNYELNSQGKYFGSGTISFNGSYAFESTLELID